MDIQHKFDRLWERFDEACHGNAQQMKDIAEAALGALEKAESQLVELAVREPVAFTNQAQLDYLGDGFGGRIFESGDIALYTAPPVQDLAALVPQDYFASLVSKARNSADKAMVKFPQPNYVLLKVAEEAGEVVQAGVHYAENRMTWQEVEGEIVQLLAMLIRLVTEGDQVNGITPPESCRAEMLRRIEERDKC